MKNTFVLGLLSLAFFSCGGDVAEEINAEKANFESEIYLVTDPYPELDAEAIPIMEKLEICTTNDTVLHLPPCSNEFFRIFDYRPTKDLKTGFIVEMIPGLYNSPVHQIVIVEDYFGKFRIVNQYLGHLIEMRTKYSGYNDLLIGYTDPDIGVVAIRHEWTNGKYEPIDVEEINNHLVKPEMKDSINNIFLPAFSAGH
ncbi:MAG: hypothetical protein ABJG68_12080 [Crocinitomicaceae bacterium]